MTQEMVLTLVADDCECIETGECTCEDSYCNCECECTGCSLDIVSGCACGGNCSCQDNDTNVYWG